MAHEDGEGDVAAEVPVQNEEWEDSFMRSFGDQISIESEKT